jgi:hypothetical protein
MEKLRKSKIKLFGKSRQNISSIWTSENFLTFLFSIIVFTCVATQEYSYSYVGSLLLHK